LKLQEREREREKKKEKEEQEKGEKFEIPKKLYLYVSRHIKNVVV